MPFSVKKDFISNSTKINAQSDPVVTALSDGRFVEVWHSFEAASGTYDLRARIFTAAGVAVGADFLVNEQTSGLQAGAKVVALQGGGFVVAWDSGAPDGFTDVKARYFGSDGKPLGVEFQVNTTQGQTENLSSLRAINGNQIAATWSSSGSLNGEARARILSGDGSVSVTSDFAFARPAGTVPLLDGVNFVGFFVENGRVTSKIFTSAGAVLPGFGSLPSGAQPIDLQNLDSGKVALFWRDADFHVKIIAANGRSVIADLTIPVASNKFIDNLTAVELDDGRFLCSWDSTLRSAIGQTDIHARIFDAKGKPSGEVFRVNSTTASAQFSPELSVLENGKVAVTWYSFDTGDGSSTTIRTTIVDPHSYVGTAGANTYVGGKLADKIAGNNGNDKLGGGSGNDRILGGAGADTLIGGAGKDTLTGGTGKDSFRYQTVKDGGDTITDFSVDDFFIFEGSAFKLGNYSGALKAVNFASRASDHLATKAVPQFIFDDAHGQLWFDANGTASGGDTLVANIGSSTVILADILIV